MASAKNVKLSRADNFRNNLRRIFAGGACQAVVARDAGIHPVHVARILSGKTPNVTIETAESLGIALEVPLETLLASNPTDADLRIFPKKSDSAA